MGRIIAQIKVTNPLDNEKSIHCSAFVDTGAAGLILPLDWKGRLGNFELSEQIELVLANNTIIKGEVSGPVGIQIEGFRKIFNEVSFIEMDRDKNGDYEPIIGYVILEQSQAAVDMLGHRLVPVKYIDCK